MRVFDEDKAYEVAKFIEEKFPDTHFAVLLINPEKRTKDIISSLRPDRVVDLLSNFKEDMMNKEMYDAKDLKRNRPFEDIKFSNN